MATYEIETTDGKYQVETADESAPDKKSVLSDPMGAINNLGKEVKELPGQLGNLAKNAALASAKTLLPGSGQFLPESPSLLDLGKQTVSGLVDEGKRIGVGELATGHPENAANKFGEALHDKPLATVLDVLPAAGAAGKMLGFGGAAEGLDLASEAAPGNLPPEAAQILKEPPNVAPQASQAAEQAVPLGSTFQETVQNLGKKIPSEIKQPLDQVKDYLGSKYGQLAEKPGWNNVVADYLKEHGQNMTLKEIGAAPGQIRKIGVDRAHALSDYAIENDLAGPKIGTIGREKLIPQRLEQAGGAVGAFRKMAADRGAVINPDELINQVRGQLDDKYLRAGLHSGEKGTYMKALMEIKKSGGRADELADKVSELFRESKNLDRLKRPSGPVADVARAVRDINHQMISKTLSPQEMAVYEHGLEDYGALTQINEFVKRRGSVEAGGRLGPGSGISRAAIQKFLDSVGYRTEAKIMRNLSEKIRTNPEIAAKPTNLFRHYIDEAADAVDEMGDNIQ